MFEGAQKQEHRFKSAVEIAEERATRVTEHPPIEANVSWEAVQEDQRATDQEAASEILARMHERSPASQSPAKTESVPAPEVKRPPGAWGLFEALDLQLDGKDSVFSRDSLLDKAQQGVDSAELLVEGLNMERQYHEQRREKLLGTGVGLLAWPFVRLSHFRKERSHRAAFNRLRGYGSLHKEIDSSYGLRNPITSADVRGQETRGAI